MEENRDRNITEFLARREFLCKAGNYSKVAAAALLGIVFATSGCSSGGGGGHSWSDYSDAAWSNAAWSNASYSDASLYGNASL